MACLFRTDRVHKTRTQGFTLVEVLVVAPMVILMLGAIIAMVVNLSSSAMRAGAQASLQNDVLLALDMIEQDVRVSTGIASSTGTIVELNNLATSKNPFDADRRFLNSTDCSVATEGVAAASALKYTVRYQISGTKLERRPTFPSGCAQTSPNIWQTRENEQLIDVQTGGTLVMAVVKDTGSGARGLKVTITATRVIAGENVSFTGNIYAKSLNLQ